MKKLIVLFLAFMMVFALVACKQDVEDTTTTNVSEDEGKEKAGVGNLIDGGTYLRYAVSLELVVQKINSQNKDSQDEKRRQIA